MGDILLLNIGGNDHPGVTGRGHQVHAGGVQHQDSISAVYGRIKDAQLMLVAGVLVGC